MPSGSFGRVNLTIAQACYYYWQTKTLHVKIRGTMQYAYSGLTVDATDDFDVTRPAATMDDLVKFTPWNGNDGFQFLTGADAPNSDGTIPITLFIAILAGGLECETKAAPGGGNCGNIVLVDAEASLGLWSGNDATTGDLNVEVTATQWY